MRVLVTGTRHMTDPGPMREAFARHAPAPSAVIVGDARGADALARAIATDMGVELVVFCADWDRHGRAAGPIRNQQMINDGHPNIVLAFPARSQASAGTHDCMRRATRQGIPVIVTAVAVHQPPPTRLPRVRP